MAKPITPPEVIREKIMEVAIEEFNEKGLKFTMDDIATRLSMSKKTLYRAFADKNELFIGMVDFYFAAVKESERKILDDDEMPILEKIRRVLIVQPEKFSRIDLRQLLSLKEKYPETYQMVAKRIEGDWEPTIRLIEKGMEAGVIRKISIPVLKGIVEGTMEHFLTGDMLIKENITYPEALEKMMDIVMVGITNGGGRLDG